MKEKFVSLFDQRNGIKSKAADAGKKATAGEGEPVDYRVHLEYDLPVRGQARARRRDWARSVAPLFGACPYMPKTKR